MSAFLFSANCVLPLFLIIGIGWLLKKAGMMTPALIDGLNTITFNVALPLLLFRDIARSDLYDLFAPSFIIYALASTFLFFVFSWIFAEWFVKDRGSIGAFVQGCFRGNYAIVGLFLINSVLGHSAKGSLIVAFAVPFYNILAIVILSIRSLKPQAVNWRKTLKDIARNPLIIGIVCGLPFALLKIPLFSAEKIRFVGAAIDYMAMSANPMALLAIGAAINFKQLSSGLKNVLAVSAIKLLIGPLIFTGIAYRLRVPLGFSGDDLLVLMITFSTPAAVASYVMASKMNNNAGLAADIVLITSLLSLFTLTGWIYLFKVMGII